MPDKDKFTFDQEDDFPESDLSSAFADGEHSADLPEEESPEPEEDLFLPGEEEPFPEQADFALPDEESEVKVKGDSGSRLRGLLLILLLVVAGAGGAYYFMDLGGTTPVVPTVAKKSAQKVDLPPQPAKTPSTQAPAVTKPVSVPAPPPPPKPAEPAQPAVEQPKTAVAKPPAEPAAPAKTQESAVEQPKTEAIQAATPAPENQPVPAKQPAPVAAKPAAPAPAEPQPAPAKPAPVSPQPAAKVKASAGGVFTLDAGSYLFEANRDALVKKAGELGYEPLVTPVEATLDMTRLRLGTFDKDEVQGVLASARSIEPGSYSAPAGERFVIYAGTFLQAHNVEKLTRLFTEAGFKVRPEPVQVVRTLSRIRFGSFATREDAEAAARTAAEAGLQAQVVKFE